MQTNIYQSRELNKKTKKRLKKKVKVMILSVFIGLISLTLASYAYLTFSTKGSDNLIKSDCLKINVVNESSGINITNGAPATDETGMQQTPYTITIKNVCKLDANYTTTLNAMNDANLDNKAKIKMAVSGGIEIEPKLISEYELTTLQEPVDNVKETYLIENGILKANEERTYNIRLWIEENVTEFEGGFDNKVIIEATVVQEQKETTK